MSDTIRVYWPILCPHKYNVAALHCRSYFDINTGSARGVQRNG